MARQGLQYRIATGRLTLPVTFILTLLVWGGWGWMMPETGIQETYLFHRILWQWMPGEWADRILMFLSYVFVAYLLIEINNACAIVRMRTSMQASVYGWLLLASPCLFIPSVGPLVACCLILSLYYLFQGYQQNEPVGRVFHAWLFWGIGTMLFPALFYFLPLLLVGAYMFKELSWRTFFAGVVGLSVPYWFLLVYAYSGERMEVFKAPFRELVNLQPLFSYVPQGWMLVSAGLLFLLLLVASLHYMLTSYDDKIRTRNYLLFLIFSGFAFVLFGVLQPQHAVLLLSVLLPIVAFLGTHLFALSQGRMPNVFFIVYMCLLLVAFSYNIWMHSYSS